MFASTVRDKVSRSGVLNLAPLVWTNVSNWTILSSADGFVVTGKDYDAVEIAREENPVANTAATARTHASAEWIRTEIERILEQSTGPDNDKNTGFKAFLAKWTKQYSISAAKNMRNLKQQKNGGCCGGFSTKIQLSCDSSVICWSKKSVEKMTDRIWAIGSFRFDSESEIWKHHLAEGGGNDLWKCDAI